MSYSIRKVDGAQRASLIIRLASECGFPNSELPDPTSGHWWLVYTRSEPVGFAGLTQAKTDPRAAFLCLAGVLPEHRGRGLQRRLIRKRLEQARLLGYARAVSYTMTWNIKSSNNLIREGFRLYWPTMRFGGHQDVNYWTLDLESRTTVPPA